MGTEHNRKKDGLSRVQLVLAIRMSSHLVEQLSDFGFVLSILQKRQRA
jgi:hypothetical protein